MKLSKVSFIIPAYNEEKVIEKCIRSIKEIEYPEKYLEVILIDDGSTDNTVKIAKKFDINIIRGKHEGVGRARNLGIKKSKGQIIFFIDADEMVSKNYVKDSIEYFKNEDLVGLDPSFRLLNRNKVIARLHFLRQVLGMKNPKSPFPKICRRKVIMKVGGIRSKFGYYDDWDFKIRVSEKGKILRCNKIICTKAEPENLKEMWRQNRWAGKSIPKLFIEYPKQTLRKLLFPALCAPLPLYLILLFTPIKILGLIGLFPFLIIELKRSLEMYKITKWKESFLTPFFDILTMDMYCIGILLGILDWKSTPKA